MYILCIYIYIYPCIDILIWHVPVFCLKKSFWQIGLTLLSATCSFPGAAMSKRIPEKFLQGKQDRARKRPKVPPPPELIQKRREVSWLFKCKSWGFKRFWHSLVLCLFLGYVMGLSNFRWPTCGRKGSPCPSTTRAMMMDSLHASMRIFRIQIANYFNRFFKKHVYIYIYHKSVCACVHKWILYVQFF